MSELEHAHFDKLHGRLMALLDIIETQHDSTLARRRFDIMEEFGYEAVAVATDPVVVPFKPSRP